MNVFDIIGPVMIGPSSSHTAGAARLGQIARKILGAPAVRAEITLCGSFAQTYRGHGTDKALIAGILGMRPDDERIRTSLELADRCGLHYEFKTASLPGAHPNPARIALTDAQGHTSVIQGASVGGGNILVSEINGMRVAVTSQYNTLIVLHHDVPGVIAAITNGLLGAEHRQFPAFPPPERRSRRHDHRGGRRCAACPDRQPESAAQRHQCRTDRGGLTMPKRRCTHADIQYH